MNFAEPLWIVVGLLVCAALTLFARIQDKAKQQTLASFTSHQLVQQLTRNISYRKRRFKFLFFISAVFCIFLALARPQYGHKWIDVKRKGIDLLFALDTSKSMLAEDIKPNRLKRAHYAILDFVAQLEGDRVGLLPFAGSAYLMCPLTIDYSAFEQTLLAVNTDIIPRGGTNIEEVIKKASEILINNANHKILIILTDGESLEGNAITAAEEAATQGLTIYTIGVGSREGELVPLNGNKPGFIKDSSGQFITSKLDEASLVAIAEKSGGMYAPLGNAGEGLDAIYQQKLSLIPKDDLAEKRHKVPLERFQWPLAIAFFLFIVEFSVNERKGNGGSALLSKLSKRVTRRRGIAVLLLLLAFITASRAHSSAGEDAYHKGEFLQASEYYRRQLEKSPDDTELLYNFGTSAYKNNMYDDAIDAFGRALKSEDISLQEKAYFNKGNSHYQKGAEMLQANPSGSAGEWKQALEALDSALALDPSNNRAKNNYEIIKKRLEELEKQLEEQQQNPDQNKQEQETKDRNESRKNQSDQTQRDQKNSNSSESTEKGENQPNKQPDQSQQSTEDAQSNSKENKPEEAVDSASQEKEKEESLNPDREEQTTPSPNEKEDGKDGEQHAAEETLRRSQGKMTKEEAEQLLNGLKNEEGELNFIPAKSGSSNNEVTKDW